MAFAAVPLFNGDIGPGTASPGQAHGSQRRLTTAFGQKQALASDRFGGSLLRSGLIRPQGHAPVAKPEHFATSQKIGELALLPAVRAADTLIVADGFSCRSRSSKLTEHGTLHLARTVRN